MPHRLLAAAEWIAANPRQEDRDEWVAGTGEPLEVSLPRAAREALLARAFWWLDAVPMAIWGCGRTELENVRQVWFAANHAAPHYALSIHRHFTRAVAEMQPPGVYLRAYSYWRNLKHHRWLLGHGFLPEAAARTSPLGNPYISFMRSPP